MREISITDLDEYYKMLNHPIVVFDSENNSVCSGFECAYFSASFDSMRLFYSPDCIMFYNKTNNCRIALKCIESIKLARHIDKPWDILYIICSPINSSSSLARYIFLVEK